MQDSKAAMNGAPDYVQYISLLRHQGRWRAPRTRSMAFRGLPDKVDQRFMTILGKQCR